MAHLCLGMLPLLHKPIALKWSMSQPGQLMQFSQRVYHTISGVRVVVIYSFKKKYRVLIVYQALTQTLGGTHTLSLCLNFFSRMYTL